MHEYKRGTNSWYFSNGSLILVIRVTCQASCILHQVWRSRPQKKFMADESCTYAQVVTNIYIWGVKAELWSFQPLRSFLCRWKKVKPKCWWTFLDYSAFHSLFVPGGLQFFSLFIRYYSSSSHNKVNSVWIGLKFVSIGQFRRVIDFLGTYNLFVGLFESWIKIKVVKLVVGVLFSVHEKIGVSQERCRGKAQILNYFCEPFSTAHKWLFTVFGTLISGFCFGESSVLLFLLLISLIVFLKWIILGQKLIWEQ